MPGNLLERGKRNAVSDIHFGERGFCLSEVRGDGNIEESFRGRGVLESRGASEDLAPVVAGEPNRCEFSGPPAQVDFMRSADVEAAVGQPNRLFCESRKVVEEIWAEWDDMMRLVTCVSHILRHVHVEAIAINPSIRITRR